MRSVRVLRSRASGVDVRMRCADYRTRALGALQPSIRDVARNEAGPRVRPGEAWHVASRVSRRLRCNEDAKQVQRIILAGVV